MTDNTAGWIDFWNRPNNAIYVNERNLEVHFETLRRDVVAFIPAGGRVLDFGCGDALIAEAVAERAGTVHLFDAAPAVQRRIRERFAGHPRVRVLDAESLAAMPDGSVDLIIVISVVQYLSRADLAGLMAQWRRLLAPDGQLLVADVVEPHTPMYRDVGSQLTLAWRHGFFLAALCGLAKLAFSDYRRIRRESGFSTYMAADMLGMLADAGFKAKHLPRNVGPTPHRNSFLATKAG
ncbi:MAG TPA: methyltransferase domain-containing protein [Azospirillum sp.]|nr:methyltransferase domain-containing protein [Azospirillum sp.]